MKRFYTILSLFLLSLVGITQAVAQEYEQGDLLTNMDDVVGKKVLVYAAGGVAGDHPSGYLNGLESVTEGIGENNVYTFELVDGETADGNPLYRLKQVKTELYFAEPNPWGVDDDDTPVKLTSNADQAFKFCSLPFVEYDPDGFTLDADNWRQAATPQKQDLSQEGFVFSHHTLPTNWNACYLGSIGTPFYSPYTDTNVWLIYSLKSNSGVDKLTGYLDYYFSEGPDAFNHGNNPGQYSEEAWQEANDAYYAANELYNGTHSDAEYDAMCERLKNAYENLMKSVVPLKTGYYRIHDCRGTANYLYSRPEGSNEFIGAGAYTANDPLEASDAKYIWYVNTTDKENVFTIKNYYSESYMCGKSTNDRYLLDKEGTMGVALEGKGQANSFLIYAPQDDATDHNKQFNTSNGYIISSWQGQAGDLGNNYIFETVDESLIKDLESGIRQQALNERLQKLYDEAAKTKALNDGSYGLVSDAANLSSNATCKSEGSLAGLLDGNLNTYFHTDWTGNNDPKTYHYLQADLGAAVSGVKMTYTGRYRAAGKRPGNQPKTIEVYVTNDTNGEWTDLGTFEMPYTDQVIFQVNETKKDTVDNYAGTLDIAFNAPYRYFRFDVLGTTAGENEEKLNGYPFWYLSELRLHSNEPNQATNYSMVDANVRSAFEAQLQAASEALAAGTATAEGIDALQAAYDELIKNLPDPSRILALANKAKETVKKAAVGDEPGYYAQASIDEINKAIAQAEAIAKPGMTLAQVNEALAALQNAVDAFSNSLILPQAGKFYFIRSASEKKNWQLNKGYNSKRAPLYSRDNALTGAVRFTMPNNGYEDEGELNDTIDLYKHVKYLWYVEKSGNMKVVIRNVGTGMYLSNTTKSNNAALAQSTEPAELNVLSAKAGAFAIEVGEGIYANAQLGGAMVAWNDPTDDNGSLSFEEAAADNFADADYYWTVTPGAYQIITLPVSVNIPSFGDGTAYTLVGQSDDNKLVLSKLEGTVEAGTPFIFKANEGLEDDNHLPNAYFETTEGNLGGLNGALFTYNFTPKHVNGLTGTVAETDTCYNDRAYFSAGELRCTRTGKAAIYNNSGYFDGSHATGVSADNADATIDIPEGSVINGISQVVVLPEVVDVYSLQGVLVRKNVKSANAVKGLPAGIYVIGGQKVIVK